MWLSDFPGCCGLKVIQDFDRAEDYPEDSIKKLNEKIQLAKHSDAGIVFATTSRENDRTVSKLLKKTKFKKFVRFLNPNTGNMVTVYWLDIRKVKKDQKTLDRAVADRW